MGINPHRNAVFFPADFRHIPVIVFLRHGNVENGIVAALIVVIKVIDAVCFGVNCRNPFSLFHNAAGLLFEHPFARCVFLKDAQNILLFAVHEDKCRRKPVFVIPAARIVTILHQLASIIHASDFIRRPRRAVQNLLDAIGQRRGVSRIRTGNRQHHQHYHPQDHQQILFHGKSSISVLPFHPYQRFTSHISSSQSKFFRFSSRKRHFSAAIHEKFSP